MSKIKSAGRPAGSANKSNGQPRNEKTGPHRVTEGFNKTIDNLLAVYPEGTSKSDLFHEAIRDLAIRKLNGKIEVFWINKIM